MAYLRAALAGVAGALLAMIAAIALIIGVMFATAWLAMPGQDGSAGIGAVSVGIPEPLIWVALLAVLGGFYGGFRWQWRRAARR